MNRIKSLWIKISELGLSKKENSSIGARSIVYCNEFSVVIALLLFQNSFSDAYNGLFFYSLLDLILILFLLPVFLLNRYRVFTGASIYLVLYCNIGIFILSSINGKESGNYIFFLDVILLNFFVFNYAQKLIILANFLLTSLLMICLEITEHSLFLDRSLTDLDKQYLFNIAIFSNGCFIFFCMYSIVSSYSKIESELQAEENTLKSIFNFSPLGIALLDNERRIISFNINLNLNLTKLTNLEILIGQDFLKYFPENEKLSFANYFELAQAGRIIRIEKYFKSDYASFWFDIMFSPISEDKKTFQNIALSVVDITKRKKLEIDVQIAKDKAEAANTSKSRFLSKMSKEFRSPMNEIIELTDNLISDNLRSDQADDAKKLEASSKNLLVLIDEILNYDSGENSELNSMNHKVDSATRQGTFYVE